MSHFQKIDVQSGRITKYSIVHDQTPLTYYAVIDGWINHVQFRRDFTKQLADSPFAAFRFETPAVTAKTLDQPFEFVLLNSPSLSQPPTDTATFCRFFTDDDTNSGIVTFENLGRDATLIVPSPRTSPEAYGHLAAFVRAAPAAQRDAFWRVVGNTLQEKIGTMPKWLSTAGGGVAWLHARIDDRPKYYGFAPYRDMPGRA